MNNQINYNWGMNKRKANAEVVGILMALALMFILASYMFNRSACVKIDNKVFYTESLTVATGGQVSYKQNGYTHWSNDAEYVWANNPSSCDEIFPND